MKFCAIAKKKIIGSGRNRPMGYDELSGSMELRLWVLQSSLVTHTILFELLMLCQRYYTILSSKQFKQLQKLESMFKNIEKYGSERKMRM